MKYRLIWLSLRAHGDFCWTFLLCHCFFCVANNCTPRPVIYNIFAKWRVSMPINSICMRFPFDPFNLVQTVNWITDININWTKYSHIMKDLLQFMLISEYYTIPNVFTTVVSFFVVITVCYKYHFQHILILCLSLRANFIWKWLMDLLNDKFS